VPQLAGHIHPALLLALRRAESPAIPAALHEDEPVGVIVALTELEVSPPEAENLTLAQAGTNCNQE